MTEASSPLSTRVPVHSLGISQILSYGLMFYAFAALKTPVAAATSLGESTVLTVLGNSRRVLVGHFHHQLHHRYFECNYGSVDFPLDVWFGTFHDGTVDARRRLKERLGPR